MGALYCDHPHIFFLGGGVMTRTPLGSVVGLTYNLDRFVTGECVTLQQMSVCQCVCVCTRRI